MKTLLLLFMSLALTIGSYSQIITPQVKANFGIDADLKSNFFNGVDLANNDDWFSSGVAGTGKQVIDTSGAAAIVAKYITNPASRNAPIIRKMSYPVFSKVNGQMLIDAVYVRDFHGNDSTMFAAGSNKNGQNPAVWTSPIAQSIPDKNEILDAFMHVRRGGLAPTDSLWMFGAVSIENTTGNRYFDFEMYQSDIFFNRSTQKFSGYGPDAGHTTWKFDRLGNIISPGDIILTAEYSSSSLTMIEARIWVNKSSLTTVPKSFKWGGKFDGATNDATFGYASILPLTAGAFYSGLQSPRDTWGGPFKIVLGNNAIADNYLVRQFMEFSVNLTKLGLDPVTLLGGGTCNKPFNRVLIKTRSSTSFTAELKDFVGPFDLFNPAKVDIFTDVPFFCGVFSVSNLKVINPVATSIYSWSTTNGHIANMTNTSSIFVDAPGTYIVTQRLQEGCGIYASDTITIGFNSGCGILSAEQLRFIAKLSDRKVYLSWKGIGGTEVNYGIERSTDGLHFYPAGKVYGDADRTAGGTFSLVNNVQSLTSPFAYYRLVIINKNGERSYSTIVKFDLSGGNKRSMLNIAPNPVKDVMSLNIFSATAANAQVRIYDATGRARLTSSAAVQGNSVINLPGFQNWEPGIYTVKLLLGDEVFVKRVLIDK